MVQSLVIDVIPKNHIDLHSILLNYVMEMGQYDRIYLHVIRKDVREILIELIFGQVVMDGMNDIQ